MHTWEGWVCSKTTFNGRYGETGKVRPNFICVPEAPRPATGRFFVRPEQEARRAAWAGKGVAERTALLSEIADKLRAATTKPAARPALLVLEDGATFAGTACGAEGEVFGEICFNTSLEGYLEVITDPSYAGQIVTLTYPQQGNYGVNPDDVQRDRCALRGLVVRDMNATPSNWRSAMSLPDFLRDRGIVAVEGVDTRALVRHVREAGAQRAVLSTVDADGESLLAKVRASAPLVGANLVAGVSCGAPHPFYALPGGHDFAVACAPAPRFKVVAYDCGAKDAILQNLVRAGCEVTVVPWDTPADDVLAMGPDGVFLSNGPGDPEAVAPTYEAAQTLLGRVPVFGICLGHQMMAKAAGAAIEKLKFGHRGGNHPVMNLLTGRVEITAQNHGFGCLWPSLGPLVPELSGGCAEHPADGDLRHWVREGVAPVVANERFGRIQLTHVNLNDGTCEGMRFLDVPAFSVQYHPEASPGPTDAHYLFTAFTRLMEGRPDYLDIDIAADRLAGWTFGTARHPERAGNGPSRHPERAERVEGSRTKFLRDPSTPSLRDCAQDDVGVAAGCAQDDVGTAAGCGRDDAGAAVGCAQDDVVKGEVA